MTHQASEAPEQIATPPFWKRHPKKLIVLAVFLALCSQMPLWGYLERVFLSVVLFGYSQTTVKAIEEQNDWFNRYFTGPPSDAEMISHFRKHRAEFEQLAYLQATQGYCHNKERERPGQECTRLERIVGMQAGLTSIFLGNSALRSCSKPYSFPCTYGLVFRYTHKERQQWRGTMNPKIESWEKELVYAPPLLLADQFRLNPLHDPHDSMSAMRRECFWKESLDSIPPELEANPGDHAYPKCAARHIEGQWFLRLTPNNELDF